jgi:hypothetical protein
MSSPGAVHKIGPKQDDPRAACDSGDGKRSIIVQGGRQSIGPKQDDPRTLAIGPKQDDPRSPALAIGPKQDDPRSSANATVGTYNPDTDPQAVGSRCVKKKKD